MYLFLNGSCLPKSIAILIFYVFFGIVRKDCSHSTVIGVTETCSLPNLKHSLFKHKIGLKFEKKFKKHYCTIICNKQIKNKK